MKRAIQGFTTSEHKCSWWLHPRFSAKNIVSKVEKKRGLQMYLTSENYHTAMCRKVYTNSTQNTHTNRMGCYHCTESVSSSSSSSALSRLLSVVAIVLLHHCWGDFSIGSVIAADSAAACKGSLIKFIVKLMFALIVAPIHSYAVERMNILIHSHRTWCIFVDSSKYHTHTHTFHTSGV